MTDVSQDAREAVLENLRDRKLLKYLFDEEPDNCVAYGYVDAPIDLETQHEIADTLVSIVEAHIRSTIAARDTEAMRQIVQKHYAHASELIGKHEPGDPAAEQSRGAFNAMSGLLHEIDTLTSAAQDGEEAARAALGDGKVVT